MYLPWQLRSHVDVLKKAVTEEKSIRESLQESVREKALSLRKHVQENESLEFRNQQVILPTAMSTFTKLKQEGQEVNVK
jgi:5-bromo-4-chloroindolyl phosphate hydrolysis protein